MLPHLTASSLLTTMSLVYTCTLHNPRVTTGTATGRHKSQGRMPEHYIDGTHLYKQWILQSRAEIRAHGWTHKHQAQAVISLESQVAYNPLDTMIRSLLHKVLLLSTWKGCRGWCQPGACRGCWICRCREAAVAEIHTDPACYEWRRVCCGSDSSAAADAVVMDAPECSVDALCSGSPLSRVDKDGEREERSCTRSMVSFLYDCDIILYVHTSPRSAAAGGFHLHPPSFTPAPPLNPITPITSICC